MKQQIALVLVSALTVLGTACGGDDGGGGGGAGSTASSFYKAALQASCDKAFDCKDSYDPAMHDGDTFESVYGTSSQDCYDTTIQFINMYLGADYFDKIDASVSAGRITYSAADGDACIDGETAATCDQYFEQNDMTQPDIPACDTTVVGTVATGGACTIDEDCATAGDDCTDGVCTAG